MPSYKKGKQNEIFENLRIKQQKRSQRKKYHRKLLFKKIDTNMTKENLDAKQSVSIDENPRLHLTTFHDGMTEPILF